MLLARLLEPADFGLLSMAAVFTGLMQQLQDLGTGQALIQIDAVSARTQQVVFTISVAMSAALWALLTLSAPLIAAFYGDARIIPVLRVLALSFPISAFGVVPAGLMRRDLSLRGDAFAAVASMTTESVTALILAWLGSGVWALVAGKLAGALISAVSLSLARPWRLGLRLRESEAGYIFRFGGSVTLASLLWYAYSNADFLIVGRFLGPGPTGLYTMAWNLAKIPYDRLWSVLNPLILPVFSRARDDRVNLGRILIRMARLTALLTAPAVAGLGLVAPDVVAVFLGAEKWSGAVMSLRWLCLFGVFRACFVLLGSVLVSVGRVGQALRFNALSCLVMPLCFWIGQRFGPAGVAAAWALAYPVVSAGLLLPRVLEETRLSFADYMRPMLRPFGATLGMALAVALVQWFLPLRRAEGLAVQLAVGAFSYLALARWLEGDLLGELRALARDARRGL